MVMGILHRKLLRNVWTAKAQYLAVAAVVLCGVALHVSMFSAMQNLTLTRDAYYREYRFADLFFRMEHAPRAALRKVLAVPGIDRARGRIVRDVTLDVPGNEDPVSGRVVSLPWPRHAMINDIHIVNGRYPGGRSRNDVLVNPKFFQENGLRIGSELRATVGEKKYTLRVAGTALSPEFVYVLRDASSFLPDHKAFGILYAPRELAETLFGLDAAMNDVVATLEAGADPDDVKEAVEDVLDPYGLTLKVTREDQLSNQFLRNEIQGLRDSVNVIPPIFTLVAAVVIFIMLQRLVRAQRTQIGVLKAFGYATWQIYVHYVEFALFAALAGALPGLLIGDVLAGFTVKAYTTYFNFPLLKHRYYPEVYTEALLLAVCLCAAAGVAAACRIVRIQPAEAMRPPAPPVTRAILLERLEALWNLLPFSLRLILRNLFRHKGRAAFTATGIVLSCTILLMAFAMADGIDYISRAYVLETQRQDAKVGLFRPRNQRTALDFQRLPGVRRIEPLLEVPFELRLGWRKKTAVLTGLRPDARLLQLATSLGEKVELPHRGLLLNRYLASSIGARTGDRITIEPLYPGREETTVVVTAVFEEGLGLNGYMRIDDLSRLLDEPPACNALLLKVEPGREKEVKSRLKDIGDVSFVILSQHMLESFEKAVGETMGIMVGIFILFAGVISFAIIFNSATIAIAERARELSSLRVLGFTLPEVGLLLFGEFYLVVLLSLVPGLAFGYAMVDATLRHYSTDVFRMPTVIYAASYAWTVLLVAAFALLAGMAGARSLAKLDMVEALKARE